MSSNKNNYLFEKERFDSFKSWPFGYNSICNIATMAEAGFYWSGTDEENDSATCFACGKSLDGWEADDDPWSEHKKHAPQCPFVTIGKAEKDMTVNQFLELVEKVLSNILIRQHGKIRNKTITFVERKREQIKEKFQP